MASKTRESSLWTACKVKVFDWVKWEGLDAHRIETSTETGFPDVIVVGVVPWALHLGRRTVFLELKSIARPARGGAIDTELRQDQADWLWRKHHGLRVPAFAFIQIGSSTSARYYPIPGAKTHQAMKCEESMLDRLAIPADRASLEDSLKKALAYEFPEG